MVKIVAFRDPDPKYIKLIKVDEPLAQRDKETFHSGPEDCDLGNQGDE